MKPRTSSEAAMTAEEWFARRELLAKRLGVEPREVPGGAVWFLPDTDPLSAREVRPVRGEGSS